MVSTKSGAGAAWGVETRGRGRKHVDSMARKEGKK